MKRYLVIGSLLVATVFAFLRLTPGSEWPGVDESVIDHFVVEAGRPKPRPLLDWVHGDTLLFAFLCAGLAAGFCLGCLGRSLFGKPTTEGGTRQ